MYINMFVYIYSASLGDPSGPGVFEPCHGSAPDIGMYVTLYYYYLLYYSMYTLLTTYILHNYTYFMLCICVHVYYTAGQNKANPVAQILSAAMMLRYDLGQPAAADALEKAVEKVLDQGLRTGDIYSPGTILVGCKEMGEAITKAL